MRARGSESIADNERIVITFEGHAIEARRNETIAAALSAAGILDWRLTRSGARRGLFCGMGVCQDCLIAIDGCAQRACMTRIDRPMEVRRQAYEASSASPASLGPAIESGEAVLAPQVLVIGGGAAGLAAATAAARSSAEVVLVDERPALGGQFYKQLAASPDLPASRFADQQMTVGKLRITRTRQAGVTVLEGHEVVGAFEPVAILVAGLGGARLIMPQRLIVATGAFERARPVPGWTLPGVMTTGAVQTLLRSYRVIPGRRVLVAGNGPLNLQVALELVRAGAAVAAVAEAARAPAVGALGAVGQMLAGSVALVARGAAIIAELRVRGIPVLHGTVLDRIEPYADGLRIGLASLGAPQRKSTWEADIVAMGYGFTPANEVLRLLGCRHHLDPVHGALVSEVDEQGETSVAGVFAAGDCTGLGGAHAAEVSGTLAGMAAARSLGLAIASELDGSEGRLRRALRRHRTFQSGLWRLFAPAGDLWARPEQATLACRCEEVSFGTIAAAVAGGAAAAGSVKRQTRSGMGACQGRYCGRFVGESLANGAGALAGADAGWAPRPPIKPMRIGALSKLRLPDDEGW